MLRPLAREVVAAAAVVPLVAGQKTAAPSAVLEVSPKAWMESAAAR